MTAKYATADTNSTAGFKQSEVGLIPSDWSALPLSEFISYLDAGVSVNSTDEVEVGADVPCVLKTSCVSEGYFDPKEAKPIAPRDFARAKTSPRHNTIIISRMNTPALVGECGYVDRDYQDLFLPDRLWMTRHKASPPHSVRWLAYVLSAPALNHALKDLATGTSGSMKNLPKPSLFALKVPTPPTKQEQDAIAEALSDADALIESLESLVAKKRAIKQGAMQELLSGRRRLSGFTQPWRSILLGELLSRLANGAVYTPIIKPGLPVTRIETIAAGFVDYFRTGNADPTSELEKYRMQTGDILYSHINSIDHIGKVALYRGEKVLYHGMNLLLLRATENVDSRFLYCILASEPLRQKARLLAKQAVSQASINTTELRSVELILPCYKEQRAIADVLDDVEGDLACCAERLMKARQIKQGMMQELLTGRVRLL